MEIKEIKYVIIFNFLIFLISSSSAFACSCRYRNNYEYHYGYFSNISIVEVDKVDDDKYFLDGFIYTDVPFKKAKVRTLSKIKGKSIDHVLFAETMEASTCIRGISTVNNDKWLVMWNKGNNVILTRCTSFRDYKLFIDNWHELGLIE